jgi:hypothetical protein
MCGIEPSNGVSTVAWRVEDGRRRETAVRLAANARGVLPFQGWKHWLGPGSQGVALGCRVVAPLAQKQAFTNIVAAFARRMGLAHKPRCTGQPVGLQLVSPGQRPGNSTTHKLICPERATPGNARAQARNLEQTIAGNVAEILEA